MKDGFDAVVAAFKDEAIAKAAREEAAKANATTSGGIDMGAVSSAPTTTASNNGGGSSGSPTGNGAKQYKYKAKLNYIDKDYGMKFVEGTGTSYISIDDAKQNALADAKKKAKNYRDSAGVTYT
jgi:hypothetical protein